MVVSPTTDRFVHNMFILIEKLYSLKHTAHYCTETRDPLPQSSVFLINSMENAIGGKLKLKKPIGGISKCVWSRFQRRFPADSLLCLSCSLAHSTPPAPFELKTPAQEDTLPPKLLYCDHKYSGRKKKKAKKSDDGSLAAGAIEM
jgi:hypothetical protein